MAKKEEKPEVRSQEWFEYLNSIRFTKEWQKELLSLLEKDELIDGYPSTEGLAKIARMIVGDFSTQVDVVKPPTSDDRSATVKVTVHFSRNQVQHGGAADVYPNNTKAPFNSHPVATAETKALGRALKKALELKIHTHEEMLDDEVSYEKIKDTQIDAVSNMARKLGVSLDKFLARECGVTVDAFLAGVTTLSKDDGLRLIEELNKLGNAEEIPEELAV